MNPIFNNFAATITELKANPNVLLKKSEGRPIVILSHNEPKAYLIPADTFQHMLEQLADYELMMLAKEREHEPSVKVDLDDL